MEVVVTTGAIRLAKVPVKSSPPTNQHPTFYMLDTFLSPNSVKAWKGLTALIQMSIIQLPPNQLCTMPKAEN